MLKAYIVNIEYVYSVLPYDYLVCNRFSHHFRGLLDRPCRFIDSRARARVRNRHAVGEFPPNDRFHTRSISFGILSRTGQEFDKSEISGGAHPTETPARIPEARLSRRKSLTLLEFPSAPADEQTNLLVSSDRT